MIQHGIDPTRDRVRHVLGHAVGGKADAISRFPSAILGLAVLALDQLGRHADGSAACRHFLDHDRVRANTRALAHRERAQHLGPGADDHVIFERGMTLAGVPARPTERHALVDRAIVADDGGLADSHAKAVVDEESPADTRAGMDLDPRDPARKMRDHARQPFKAAVPAAVRQPVPPDGMQPRIGEYDFPYAPGGRIAFKDGVQVFLEPSQHSCPQRIVLRCRGNPPRSTGRK